MKPKNAIMYGKKINQVSKTQRARLIRLQEMQVRNILKTHFSLW